jgi:2-polyprenyl-6-methoxyphenol hydroxylase-like FAD-dependent oxidoreductase
VREPCDVAIVGYGPTGQMLAILLAQRGWRVTVLERWPTAYPMPRAVHFDHEIGRIFQAAGVADEVREICEPCTHYEWRSRTGETLLRFGVKAEESLTGWPDANMLHQPDLERVLDRRARSLGSVSVRRGFEVFAVESGPKGVRVRARDASCEVRNVDAHFAIGCDGANSLVRRSMHVPVEEEGEFDWLIVDVIPRSPREWQPANWQLCDPARPTTVISGGPGRRRFEFMRLPHESLDALNDEASAWQLLEPWGLTEADTILERHSVYTFRARWAEVWRRGRVLLAGDAAHLLPPFGAQGLGAGLRDAATLSWQLDLVLRGIAPETLLDTYAQERLPHVRSFIDVSLSLGRLVCVTNPDDAAARDAQLAELMRAGERAPVTALPVMGPGTSLFGDPRAGELFVQGRVRARGRGRRSEGLFDDVVGRGWVLISPDGDPGDVLDPERRGLFASLGGVTAHVGPGGPIADLDGKYRRFFQRTGARVVLQRPDFHLFGSGKELVDANSLVAELARQLASPLVRADEADAHPE